MEIRRILFGHLDSGEPDIRYREVKRDHGGKIVEYRTIPISPGSELLQKADRMPILVSSLEKYHQVK